MNLGWVVGARVFQMLADVDCRGGAINKVVGLWPSQPDCLVQPFGFWWVVHWLFVDWAASCGDRNRVKDLERANNTSHKHKNQDWAQKGEGNTPKHAGFRRPINGPCLIDILRNGL